MKPDNKKYRIRRLTPKEIGTLMGFKPEDDDKMKAMNISDTQRNKCYGNGIITNCVKLIFEHLFQAQYDQDYQCSDESNIKYINSERERDLNQKNAYCIDANYWKGTTVDQFLLKKRRQLVVSE